MDGVPVVNIACEAAACVHEIALLASALRKWGFFYADGHGVAKELIDQQFEQSSRLFSLPWDLKQSVAFKGELDIGYLGSGGQQLDETSSAGADTKEGFMITNNGVFNASFEQPTSDPLAGATLMWPPGLPEYEAVARQYFAEAMRVNARLNELLFASLGVDDIERQRLTQQPFAVFKQLRYVPKPPTLAPDSGHDLSARRANQTLGIGAGAHADWGAFTILATDGTPGLEVEVDGEWLPVPPRDGLLIVNAGDQIETLTNGEYRSARHRVVTVSTRPRYSTAFFTYFDYHQVVHPLPTFVRPGRPPVRPGMTTADWFHFKLDESVGIAPQMPGKAAAAALAAASAVGKANLPSFASEASCAEGAGPIDTVADTLRPGWGEARRPPKLTAPLADADFGAEMSGLQLLSATEVELNAVVGTMLQHGRGLLIARDQHLTPEELEQLLKRLGRFFGAPSKYVRWPGQSPPLRCCPHLSLLGNYVARADDELGTGAAAGERIGEYKPAIEELREWHTDGSFLQHPQVAIALYAPARVNDALPPDGGRTAFASMIAAYEALSADEQAALAGLSSVHSWCEFMRFLEGRDPERPKATEDQCAAKPSVRWPLVRTHPITGSRTLYLNPKNALRVVRSDDGREVLNGSAVILSLADRALALGVYKHAWRPGDLLLWDNRVMLHAATPFDAKRHERLLLRGQFPGEPVYQF